MHPPISREVGPPGATTTRYEPCQCADCVAELTQDCREMAGLLSRLSAAVIERRTTQTNALGREVCQTCGASEIHGPVPHRADCPVVLAEGYIGKHIRDAAGKRVSGSVNVTPDQGTPRSIPFASWGELLFPKPTIILADWSKGWYVSPGRFPFLPPKSHFWQQAFSWTHRRRSLCGWPEESWSDSFVADDGSAKKCRSCLKIWWRVYGCDKEPQSEDGGNAQ